MTLAAYARGRDNNFNLIRFLAAFSVLTTHSFTLATGEWGSEPLRSTLGMTPGSIAVDIFFIASGFLVTASLTSRGSLLEFAIARALRIYPALIAMVAITALLGALFSLQPSTHYFSDGRFWHYLLKNASLVTGLSNELPGVFTDTPLKGAINGSLWTLTYEVKMYVALALLWGMLRALPLPHAKAFKLAVIGITTGAAVLYVLTVTSDKVDSEMPRLVYMFFSGATFYLLRERIQLSLPLGIGLIAILLIAASGRNYFFPFYIATLAYILFCVAYIPAGSIRKFNQLGDYSYGIYIYAFPIQQALVAAMPGISVFSLFILSSVTTLCFAIASWHLIERRALTLKKLSINHGRNLFGQIARLRGSQQT